MAQHGGLQLHELGDVVLRNNRAVLLSHAAAAAAGVDKDLRALRDAALWRVQCGCERRRCITAWQELQGGCSGSSERKSTLNARMFAHLILLMVA